MAFRSGVLWVGFQAKRGLQMFFSHIWFLKGQNVNHFKASHCVPLRFTMPVWAREGARLLRMPFTLDPARAMSATTQRKKLENKSLMENWSHGQNSSANYDFSALHAFLCQQPLKQYIIYCWLGRAYEAGLFLKQPVVFVLKVNLEGFHSLLLILLCLFLGGEC